MATSRDFTREARAIAAGTPGAPLPERAHVVELLALLAERDAALGDLLAAGYKLADAPLSGEPTAPGSLNLSEPAKRPTGDVTPER